MASQIHYGHMPDVVVVGRGQSTRGKDVPEKERLVMAHKGFSHIGLSTRDLDSTRDFYENVLGFKVARCDIIKIAEGGQIRTSFLTRAEISSSLSWSRKGYRGFRRTMTLALTPGWASQARSIILPLRPARWQPWRRSVRVAGQGVPVTDIVDHEWAQSIYFHDPNGISLEYCCLTRDVGTEDDVTMQVRVERSIEAMRGSAGIVCVRPGSRNVSNTVGGSMGWEFEMVAGPSTRV